MEVIAKMAAVFGGLFLVVLVGMMFEPLAAMYIAMAWLVGALYEGVKSWRYQKEFERLKSLCEKRSM